jgi:hypothetical protein
MIDREALDHTLDMAGMTRVLDVEEDRVPGRRAPPLRRRWGNAGGKDRLRRLDRHEESGAGGLRRRLGDGGDRRGPGLLGDATWASLGFFSFHAPHHTGQTRHRLGR